MGISPLTLQCRAVVPSLHSTSSREVGWQSLLLDVHTGVSSTDPYTSVPTPDPRIGVTISGRYSFDYLMRGRWRHDQHGPGTICVHRTGQAERYRFPQPTDPMFTLALIYLPLDTLESALDEVRRPGQWSKIPTLHNIVDRDPAISPGLVLEDLENAVSFTPQNGLTCTDTEETVTGQDPFSEPSPAPAG